MTAEQVTNRETEGLRRDAVGLPDVIFTSVTTMAPAAGAAFSITVGALFAGGALSGRHGRKVQCDRLRDQTDIRGLATS